MRKTRCSSLPRFFACASSEAPNDAPHNPNSDQSILGTAVHHALAIMIEEGQADLEIIARKYDVKHDDLSLLYYYGQKAWGVLSQGITNAQTEIKMHGIVCDGTADIFGRCDDGLVVPDWKSGHNRTNAREQLNGYAHATANEYGWGDSGIITQVIIWLRFQEYEIYKYTRDDDAQFVKRYTEQYDLIGKQWAAGEQCTYCPQKNHCKTYSEYMQSAHGALVKSVKGGLTRDRLAELYPQAKMLKQALKQFDDAIKMAAHEAPLSIGDGKFLEMIQKTRDHIDPAIAWEVLQDAGFSDAELASSIKFTKSAIQAVAGDKAPKGQKGTYKSLIIGRLRDSGAIAAKPYLQLTVTKGNK